MNNNPEHSALLQFENLKKQTGVAHFVTTRKGGISKGPFSSFNLGNYSDDSPTNIYENRQILSRMWYMDLSDFVIPHQTHSSNVLVIDKAFMKSSASEKIEALYGVDATVTDLNEVFLCVTTADCVPILLYDKKQKIVAAVHAGWKGIVGGIIKNTVIRMSEVYNSDSSDIIASIGPSISQKNYEVGDELITMFKEAEFDLSLVTYVNEQTKKCHIDLKGLSHNELVRLGISPQQIEKSELCTFDESELFFSARRQTIVSGRMISGIKMIN